jgi:hypothetical protein
MNVARMNFALNIRSAAIAAVWAAPIGVSPVSDGTISLAGANLEVCEIGATETADVMVGMTTTDPQPVASVTVTCNDPDVFGVSVSFATGKMSSSSVPDVHYAVSFTGQLLPVSAAPFALGGWTGAHLNADVRLSIDPQSPARAPGPYTDTLTVTVVPVISGGGGLGEN